MMLTILEKMAQNDQINLKIWTNVSNLSTTLIYLKLLLLSAKFNSRANYYFIINM